MPQHSGKHKCESFGGHASPKVEKSRGGMATKCQPRRRRGIVAQWVEITLTFSEHSCAVGLICPGRRRNRLESNRRSRFENSLTDEWDSSSDRPPAAFVTWLWRPQ